MDEYEVVETKYAVIEAKYKVGDSFFAKATGHRTKINEVRHTLIDDTVVAVYNLSLTPVYLTVESLEDRFYLEVEL